MTTAGLNLFISSFPTVFGGLPLFVVGSDGTGEFKSLALSITGGIGDQSANLNLSISGPLSGVQPSNMNLFIRGVHRYANNGLPLIVIGGSDCPTSWGTWDTDWADDDELFECAECDGFDWDEEDFLWSEDPSPDWSACYGTSGSLLTSAMPLFMNGSPLGNLNQFMNLFIKGPTSGGVTLCIFGPPHTISPATTTLFVQGSVLVSSGLPLVIPSSHDFLISPGQMLYTHGF